MYRFKFEIVNEETGEQFGHDWTLFDLENIDETGGVATIDIHVAALLRCLKREASAKR